MTAEQRVIPVEESRDGEIRAALDSLASMGRIMPTVAADAGDVVAALRLAGYRIVRDRKEGAVADTQEHRYTQRGFRIYAENVTDTKGSKVDVVQSSAAEDDCVWIFAKNERWANPDPHLSVEQARIVRDALTEFINDHDEETPNV